MAALTGTLAIIAGTPAALWVYARDVLPTDLPSWDDVVAAMTQPLDGKLLVGAAALIAWAAWATFTIAVLVEIPAQIRGRATIRLPGLGLQQRIAAGIVAAVLAMMTGAGLASAAPSTPASAAPALATTPAAVAVAPSHPLALAAQAPAGQVTYVVHRGDWLYHIAERFLGAGERYDEIARLNPGLERRDQRFPDHIEATWRIVLPADAHDRGVRLHARGHLATPVPATVASPTPDIPDESIVDPGGGVGGGATAPGSTPASAPASTPATAPTTAPATSTPVGRTAANTVDHDEDSALSAPLVAGASMALAGVLAALILLRVRRRRARAQQHRKAGRRLATPIAQPEVSARHAAKPDVTRLDSGLRHLAAGLHNRSASDLPDVAAAWVNGGDTSLIFTKPSIDPPEPFTATAANTWTLDAAATLSAAPPMQPSPLPALVTVATQPSGGDLLVDAERTGVLSIIGDPQRGRSLLRYLAAEAATCTWADESAVVLAGFDAGDVEHLVTLNERRVRATTDPADAINRIARRAAANSAALAAGGHTDAAAARITDLAGDTWPAHILLLADPDGRYTEQLAELDQQLQAGGRAGVAILVTTPQSTTWHLDIDEKGHVDVPWLGTPGDVLACELSPADLAGLATLVQETRPEPASILDPAMGSLAVDEPVPLAVDLGPWTTGVDQHGGLLESLFGPADSEPVDDEDDRGGATLEDTPEDVPDAKIEPADLNDATGGEEIRPLIPRGRGSVLDPTLDEDFTAWHAADPTRPRVGILGPVHVDAPGVLPEERRRFYEELVVFLAQRGERGATTDEIIGNLWSERGVGPNVVRVYISKARHWLGEDSEGEAWIPVNSGAGAAYKIKPGYLLDWKLFCRRRVRAQARGPAGGPDYRAALELVRGVPLDGADRAYGPRNPFAWLPDSTISPYHLTAAIVDTAHQYVELCLAGGDTEGARWAVHRAWAADPDRTDDHPWRDLMRIAHAEGKQSELRAIVGDLMQTREAEVPEDLATPTCALVYELLGDQLPVGVGFGR